MDIRLNQRGSILVMVLWTIMLLAFMAVHLVISTNEQVHVYKRLGDRGISRRAAEAALLGFSDHFRRRESKLPFTLSESISGGGRSIRGELDGISYDVIPKGLMSESGQDYSQPTNANQIHAELSLDKQYPTSYGIIDQNRKININTSDVYVLQKLIKQLSGMDDDKALELAAGIVDYRDEDDVMTIQKKFLGSEKGVYRSAGLQYLPKNKKFEYLFEVLQVPGMTEKIYRSLRHQVTVFGHGQININTSTNEVLLALGLNSDLVQKILHLRIGPDQTIGTGDDGIFRELASAESQLAAKYDLSESERLSLRHGISRRYFTTSSEYFKVKVARSFG
ncbi:MAG: hypothetical protein ACI9CF_001014 [Candidatus Omnitrophota bacterium]|jgi:hypothetical protein